MLRLNRLQRSLHTSAPLQIFKKKASTDYAANNLFKRGTPKKTAGSIQNFRKTAAYGQFSRDAVKIPAGQLGSAILQLDANNNQTLEKEEDVSSGASGAADLSKGSLDVGSVVQYDIPTRRALSYFGSFQRDQHHELFKERTTMIRGVSLELEKVLENGKNTPSSENRVCLIGDRGVGKSTTLAQAQALAVLKGYIVIPVPYAQELVSGRNDALYNESHGFFAQPMYVKRWMKRVAKGNAAVLKEIAVPKGLASAQYEAHSPKMSENLYNFLLEGRRRRDAFVIMHEFLQILSTSGSDGVQAPVLFTLDELNAFCHNIHSVNRDTHNRPIYHGYLQVPKYFLQYLSGASSFNRGAIIAATTGKYRQNDTIPMGLGVGVSRPEDLVYADKTVYDKTLAAKLKGVRPLVVERYSETESLQMLQLYQNAGLISDKSSASTSASASDEGALSATTTTTTSSSPSSTVMELHLLAGVGNARDLLRTCMEYGCK